MPKDKNNIGELDLKKYQTKDSVSLNEMNFGLWFAEKRAFLMRLLITSLIFLSAVFFIFSAYQYYIYYINKGSDLPAVDNNLISPRNITTDLKIESPQFFKNGDRYDLIVQVANPNDKFSANFDACFNLSGNEFTCQKTFILPSETKYVFSLGKEVKDNIRTLSFSVKNINWQRVDSHAIPDWTDFLKTHLNFAYSDISFYNINDSNSNIENGSNILEFNAKNLGAYSYYDFPLNIAIFEGDQLVGVNVYHLQNFLGGETRNVKINWPGNFNNIHAEIVPDLNILDDRVYLKYQGSQTS